MAEFLATPLGTFLLILVQGLGIIAFVMLSLLFLVYGDRKIWAAVQMRRGPNTMRSSAHKDWLKNTAPSW